MTNFQLFQPLNLEKAVEPQINTDGHRSDGLAQETGVTGLEQRCSQRKSVLICVNLWLLFFFLDSNCRIQVEILPTQ
jgi:hypothetical protein